MNCSAAAPKHATQLLKRWMKKQISPTLLSAPFLFPGASAPKLVTRDMLKGMKEGSVLVDVAIDQGGCFETSKATTHEDPTYEVDGVLHYCVANMPGAVPHDLISRAQQCDPRLWACMLGRSRVSTRMRQNPHLRLTGSMSISGKGHLCKAVSDALECRLSPQRMLRLQLPRLSGFTLPGCRPHHFP